MIRKRIRRAGEQWVYQAGNRAQAKTLAETVCLTCQYDKGCTQVIGLDGSGSESIPSQVHVLSRGERGILRRNLDNQLPSPTYN